MCGFVGIAGDPAPADAVARMLETVRHRGPDGSGIHASPGVALGHVRLAIVDTTTAGAQPMLTPCGRYALVYNGELYNHADFRTALEARGVRFRGRSDTETLLWLLVEHGEAILPRLNGIFAFAFVDFSSRRVLLARDQLGVKPLYYATTPGGQLLFGSEIKALFATGAIEPRANVDDLLELLMFHFIAGERTAFAGIRELLPGHIAVHDNGRLSIRRYWDPLASARYRLEQDGHLPALLASAVQRQLMSDVPIAVMSSGGLDSGAVVALAGAAFRRGFCFRDPALGYDELEASRTTAAVFGVEIEEVRVDPRELPDLLLRLAWHHDEPIPRPHHLAAYAVARQARAAGFKVLLSGEGGDEVFGGYTRYEALATTMHATGDTSPLVFAHNRVACARIARFWPQQTFDNPFRQTCAGATEGLDLVNRQLLVDQQTFLQHFLQRSDRMGMAAGVENRVPLLDIELVEYTNRLPGCLKVGAGETKRAFRRALARVLPAETLARPKRAFEMPMAPLLCEGPVADLLDDVLLDAPRCGTLFDTRGIARLVADLRAGDESLWKTAWLLLTTELWLRAFRVSM